MLPNAMKKSMQNDNILSDCCGGVRTKVDCEWATAWRESIEGWEADQHEGGVVTESAGFSTLSWPLQITANEWISLSRLPPPIV